jgi:hypothetical protein
VAVPRICFLAQTLAPSRCELVKLGAPIILRSAPACLYMDPDCREYKSAKLVSFDRVKRAEDRAKNCMCGED